MSNRNSGNPPPNPNQRAQGPGNNFGHFTPDGYGQGSYPGGLPGGLPGGANLPGFMGPGGRIGLGYGYPGIGRDSGAGNPGGPVEPGVKGPGGPGGPGNPLGYGGAR